MEFNMVFDVAKRFFQQFQAEDLIFMEECYKIFLKFSKEILPQDLKDEEKYKYDTSFFNLLLLRNIEK